MGRAICRRCFAEDFAPWEPGSAAAHHVVASDLIFSKHRNGSITGMAVLDAGPKLPEALTGRRPAAVGHSCRHFHFSSAVGPFVWQAFRRLPLESRITAGSQAITELQRSQGSATAEHRPQATRAGNNIPPPAVGFLIRAGTTIDLQSSHPGGGSFFCSLPSHRKTLPAHPHPQARLARWQALGSRFLGVAHEGCHSPGFGPGSQAGPCSMAGHFPALWFGSHRC